MEEIRETTPILKPGEVVSERYKISKCLDPDGRGVVFSASDSQTGLEVVLKTLPSQQAQELYQLKREFRLVQSLRHRNLVKFYELNLEQQFPFFTMELIEGLSFDRYFQHGYESIGLQEFLQVFMQLAIAIDILHRNNIIHSDVKPTNVMVSRGGRVVLMDFGLSRYSKESFTFEEIAGTQGYMAPEQEAGKLERASDWFSYGTILKEIVGRFDFKPKNRVLNLASSLTSVDPRDRPGLPEIVDLFRKWLPEVEQHGLSRTVDHYLPRPNYEDWLNLKIADATSGMGPQALCVSGESGIGKSTLIREVLSKNGSDSSSLLLVSTCSANESVQLNAFDNIIDDLSRCLLSLTPQELEILLPEDTAPLLSCFPILARIPIALERSYAGKLRDESENKLLAYRQLRGLFNKLSPHLIFWIDDSQWMDESSLELFSELVRPPSPPRALYLFSFRETSESDFKNQLENIISAHRIPCQELEIEGFDLADSENFAKLYGLESANSIPGIKTTGGNPMLMKLHCKFPGGSGEVQDNWTDNLLRNLSDEGRQATSFSAIAGYPLPQDVFSKLGISASEVQNLIEHEIFRIVKVNKYSGLFIELYHDRIRNGLLELISEEKQRELHQRLAEVLTEDIRISALKLVSHFLAAKNTRQAIQYSLLAAGEAESNQDFENAGRFYLSAFRLGGNKDSDWGLLAKAGRAIGRAGSGIRAGELLMEAATLALNVDPESTPKLKTDAVTFFLYAGAFEPAREALREIASLLALDLSSKPNLFITAFMMRIPWIIPRPIKSDMFQFSDAQNAQRLDLLEAMANGLSLLDHTRYHRIALTWLNECYKARDRKRFSAALGMEAVMQSFIGGSALRKNSKKLIKKAIELRPDTPFGEASEHIWSAAIAFNESRWRDAKRLASSAEFIMLKHHPDAKWHLNAVHAFQFGAMAMMGDLGEMKERLPLLVTDARNRGDMLGLNLYNTSLCSIWRLALDQADEILESSGESELSAISDVFSSHDFYRALGISMALLYKGEADIATSFLDAEWPRVKSAQFLNLELLGVLLWYIRLCTLLAHTENVSARENDLNEGLAYLKKAKVKVASPLHKLCLSAKFRLAKDTVQAKRLLTASIPEFSDLDMGMHILAVERRTHQLGSPLRDIIDVDREFMEVGVLNPQSFVNALTP